MKVEFLQSVITAIGSFEKGDVHDIEDDHTLDNWTRQGLIRPVKGKPTRSKGTVQDEN